MPYMPSIFGYGIQRPAETLLVKMFEQQHTRLLSFQCNSLPITRKEMQKEGNIYIGKISTKWLC